MSSLEWSENLKTCWPAPKIRVSDSVFAILSSTTATRDCALEGEETCSRTELDSHTNMAVVGRNAYILGETGRTANVSPLTIAYATLQDVPIVDAAIALYEKDLRFDLS